MRIAPFQMPHPDGSGFTQFPGYCVPPNGICILTGTNGAGKTSLLKFVQSNPRLLGYMNGGNLVILDQMYERLLFPYKPVWWNVSLPRILADSLPALEAKRLAKGKLHEFRLDIDPDAYPDNLSGGEKHLILILRMSLCSHSVLLLDEPATGVDASRVDLLWTMISHLVSTAKKQVLLSTHRDVPPWERANPLTFAGIRGAPLRIETLTPNSRRGQQDE